MLVEAQRGTAPGRILARAKVVYSAGPEGRFGLEVDGAEHDPYVLVSDTQKSWAYVPKLKQYTETEGATVSDPDEDGGSDAERDLAAVFTQGLPEVFAKLIKTAAQAGPGEPLQVKQAGKKYTWPASMSCRSRSRAAPKT